jgi:hypothetical protein
MQKKIPKIVVLLFLMPALCHATTLTFTGDDVGTIDGGNYDTVDIFDTATVSMTAGSVGNMYIHNLGTLNFHNGTISGMQLWNSGTLNLEGASLTDIELFDSSIFNLNSGIFEGIFEAPSYITININDGQVNQGDGRLRDYAIANIYGGDVTWEMLSLDGHAALNVYGGNVVFEHGFSFQENSQFNVYYSDIIYINEWDDIIIGYHLLDGSEFMLDQYNQAEIDHMNFVPEPTTFLLLGLGGLLLRKRK